MNGFPVFALWEILIYVKCLRLYAKLWSATAGNLLDFDVICSPFKRNTYLPWEVLHGNQSSGYDLTNMYSTSHSSVNCLFRRYRVAYSCAAAKIES